MGLRWPFDQENDRAIFNEWKKLIPHVAATLQYLTLEDRYLVIGYNKPTLSISGGINPQAGEELDPEDWSRAFEMGNSSTSYYLYWRHSPGPQ